MHDQTKGRIVCLYEGSSWHRPQSFDKQIYSDWMGWLIGKIYGLTHHKYRTEFQIKPKQPPKYRRIFIFIYFLVKVRLRTEVLCTPSLARAGFELMTSRSWQCISCHWDTFSNHLAIGDFYACHKSTYNVFIYNIASRQEALWWSSLTD